MASDEHDKTVFRQAPTKPDRTVIRPSPGRRGQSGTAAQPPQQPAAAGPSTPTPATPPPAAARPSTQYQPGVAVQQGPSGSLLGSGNRLNPLVNQAATLIAVFEQTRKSMSHPDVGGLHQRLVSEIRQFDSRAREQGIAPEVVLSARYCLCTALDEAVLNTPWGSESAWPQRSLLSVFHNETSGGEKFFQILKRMLEQPAMNIDFLELMYILLSLGFEGRYRVVNNGRDTIEQIRDELFAVIRRLRGDYERSLSPHWQGLGKAGRALTSYLPMWVVASVVVAVLLLGYLGFRVWLLEASSPVIDKLDRIALVQEPDRTAPGNRQ